jgi:hypothetical protein
MILRYCRRCGEVEAVDDPGPEAEHTVECAGEGLALCTRCWVEFQEWFFDQAPEPTVVDSAP